MELILRNADVTIPQAIENIQYLRQELAARLDYYKGVIVTEDTIKDAKADRANLNKLKSAIDDQRKEVKRQTMALYEPLEKECKELLSMIDEPIGVIDSQLKAFDEQKKAAKYQALTEFFAKVNTLNFVKIEHVLNPKWGNATSKLDALKDEMSGNIQRIVDDYADIKKLYADSTMLTAILQRFEQTRDKGAALAYAAEIERREKAEQERREREAAEKARREQEQREAEQIQRQPEEVVTYPTIAPVPAGPAPEPIGQATFRVIGTRSQLRTLAAYMRENGIKYEVLK
jgi:uncharacterized membrane protein YccC